MAAIKYILNDSIGGDDSLIEMMSVYDKTWHATGGKVLLNTATAAAVALCRLLFTVLRITVILAIKTTRYSLSPLLIDR